MLKKRPEQIVMLVIIALVIVAVVVLVLSFGRRVDTYDSKTPEGAAQAYLNATFEGDFDRAATFLEPTSDCDAADLDRAYLQNNARISLVETVTEASRSRVRISVEVSSGGPLGGVYREEHTLRLVESGGQWLLTGVPWPLYDCTTPNG